MKPAGSFDLEMRVLAIDTSFEACSAALLDGADALWAEQRMIGRGHAETLPPMVAGGLAATRLKIADLERVVVVVGPGAFAGVRVGIAFARSLCLGTKARAVGVTSLAALAASILDADPLLGAPARDKGVVNGASLVAPIFDARRGQTYAALYDPALRERIAPFVADPENAAARLKIAAAGAPIALAGSGAALLAPHLPGASIAANAGSIDPASLARLAARANFAAGPPAPLYLRPPDAKPAALGVFAGLQS